MNLNIKDLKVTNKAKALALAGLLGTSILLNGCNQRMLDTKYKFNKAIILNEERTIGTIVDVEKWRDYDGEQIQLETKEGLIILTSSFDTKLINDEKSKISAEEVVKSLLGEDAQINYIGERAKTK